MATELGKAYVQIIPSAKGISGSISKILSPEATSAGDESGKSLGGSLVTAVKGVIVAAGIGKAFASAISEGADLEQSIGGVETLFKDSATKVQEYARQSYKTVGVSANEYMENVTSFSASLLQSMGGDTEKAAEVANMAMIDMGDNANKMGTDMRDIQNAYQGFAKHNYTMLDNLKLGYGGTKTEMERLLKDAQELSGVEYNIDNLADVYEAIHVIQEELGITGTTALEAAETVSGSAAAMKAAFKDVLGNLAIGENVAESMQNLAETISTFLFDNLIPMIMQVLQGLPAGITAFLDTIIPLFLQKGGELIQNLAQGMSTEFPNLFTKAGEIIDGIIKWIQNSLPQLLSAGVEIISNIANGFLQGLPEIIEGAGAIISGLLEALLAALPQIAEAGLKLVGALASALIDNAPQILTAIGKVVLDLIAKIVEHLPQFIEKGSVMVANMIQGITTKIPEIVAKLLELLTSLVSKIIEKLPEFLAKGKEIITKMIEGITATTTSILTALGTLLTELVTAIFNKLPEFLAKGKEVVDKMKLGITEKKTEVVNAINDVIQGVLNKIGEWYEKFKQAGAKIAGMIGEGISNAKTKVTNAASGVAKGIRNLFPFSPAKEGPLKDLHKLDFSIIADGIYKANNPIQKATKALAQSVKDGLNPANEIFDEFQNQNFESLIGYKVTSKLNDASFNNSEVSEERPINLSLNIGGQVFRSFVDRVTLEQDREIDLELAY